MEKTFLFVISARCQFGDCVVSMPWHEPHIVRAQGLDKGQKPAARDPVKSAHTLSTPTQENFITRYQVHPYICQNFILKVKNFPTFAFCFHKNWAHSGMDFGLNF